MDNALKKVPVLMGMVMLLLAPAPYPSLGAEGLSRAPINPAFHEHGRKKANVLTGEVAGVQSLSQSGPFFGYIPSPVDRSHLRGQSLPGPQLLSTYPSTFDLRLSGDLTPVRNQGACGSCWAFASYGALESRLLITANESQNFSENNLKNLAGFDWGPCDGGNFFMTTAYLSRWDGPVSENDDPYNPSSSDSPDKPERKHLQESLWFPTRTGPLDNDAVKKALTTYGAVFTSMYYENSSFNRAYNAYYDSSGADPNHAVVIVGWDDNFDRNRFSPAAPGNGAFIVRNSWGSGWGQNGYFYISYYDLSVGYYDVDVLNDAQPISNFSRVYQYDPLGLTNSYGYPTSSTPNTGWFANVFTVTGKERLSAASFYTLTSNASYQVDVYVDVQSSPTGGTLVASYSGTIDYPGYHTIPFTTPVGLNPGQRFAVVVKLTTPGYNYPIPVETPFDGYASPNAGPGQSYVSRDGTSWTDITFITPVPPDTLEYANTNVCLKAFTDVFPTGSISIKGGAAYTTTSTVPVTISASADTTLMQFSTNGTTWTAWESVKLGRSLPLPAGDGVKTIAVRFRNGYGNVSETTSDSIILDTRVPTGAIAINGGAYSTTSTTVELTLAAADINGVKQMQFSENGITWSLPEAYAATKRYTFASATPGTKKVYARFIDNAGKVSAACADTIVLAATAPPIGTPGHINIKNGDAYTIVATVPLTIINPGAYTGMRFSTNGATWTAWESFKTSRSMTLPAGDGIKTVYLQFRDGTVAVPDIYAGTIILHTKAPTGGVSINGGAGSTGSATVTLSLAAADINGVKEMQFSENGTTWSSPEAYAATRSYTFASTAPGIKKAYVRFIDNAGKVSSPASDTITLVAP